MQLPTYDGTKSYQNLLVGVYGGQSTSWTSFNSIDTAFQQKSTSFIRSGFYDSSNVVSRSIDGRYWQADAYSPTNAWQLFLNPGYLIPQTIITKGTGLSIRCLVR